MNNLTRKKKGFLWYLLVNISVYANLTYLYSSDIVNMLIQYSNDNRFNASGYYFFLFFRIDKNIRSLTNCYEYREKY